MKRNSEMDQAINFHIELDIKRNLESPNETWPDFLIDYYKLCMLEENKNE